MDKPVIKLSNGKVFLFNLVELNNIDISFHFLPNGIVIKDHTSDSSYSVNVTQALGVCDDFVLYQLLLERGLTPDEQYPLLFLNDGYYLEPKVYNSL